MTQVFVCFFVHFKEAIMKPGRVGIAPTKLKSLTLKAVLRNICIFLGILEMSKNVGPCCQAKFVTFFFSLNCLSFVLSYSWDL